MFEKNADPATPNATMAQSRLIGICVMPTKRNTIFASDEGDWAYKTNPSFSS